jgi:hypothetical protein
MDCSNYQGMLLLSSTYKIHTTNTKCSLKHHQRIQGTFTTHKIMNKSTRNKHPLFNIANNALVDLPAPTTIQRMVKLWITIRNLPSSTNPNRFISSYTLLPKY